jgi:cation:H+ antiporter
MLFYSAAILVLIFFTIRGQYTSITGIILILVYIGYLFKLYTETKEHQESVQERNDEIKEAGGDKPYSEILPIVFLCLFGIYFLIEVIVKSAIVVSTTFNIPTIIVSLIVLASATSIPDTLLSIKSSTRGDIDGALSNAVGSNIFDLSICLGMPLLLVKEPVVVGLRENLGIIFFLILSMITTAYVLLNKKGLSKNSGIYMGISYACFLGYIVLVGFGVL